MYVQSLVQTPVKSSASKSTDSSSIDSSAFSIGPVISRSFSTLFKHPFVFVGLTILAQAPRFAIAMLNRNPEAGGLAAVAAVINIAFLLTIQGATAYAVFRSLQGHGVSLGECLSRGMRRVIPLLFAVLSLTVFHILLFMVAFFVGWLFLRLGPSGFSGLLVIIPIVLVVGLVMCVLLCKWCVFAPVCVVERLGPIKSLNRSSELTKGCRAKIYGIYQLCGLIFLGVMVVFQLIAFFTGFFILVNYFIAAVMAAFFHVTTAVIYYELRNVKEGVGIEQLANVFD